MTTHDCFCQVLKSVSRPINKHNKVISEICVQHPNMQEAPVLGGALVSHRGLAPMTCTDTIKPGVCVALAGAAAVLQTKPQVSTVRPLFAFLIYC